VRTELRKPPFLHRCIFRLPLTPLSPGAKLQSKFRRLRRNSYYVFQEQLL
jgi:hypothetical protein